MDETLKVRLVGALVLIALMALFWPLVFDDAEEIKLSQQSQIPAPPKVEEWQVAERELPPTRIRATDDIEVSEQGSAQGSAVAIDSYESTDQQNEGSSADTVGTASNVMREAWAVKVASLNDLENGSRLVEKLLKDGYRAYGRVSSAEKGQDIMRVYIGPKFDKRRADSIKLEVDREYAVKSMVVPYQPDAV